MPVDTHAIPVVYDERSIAVVEQHTNLLGIREPELTGAGLSGCGRRPGRDGVGAAFPIAGDLFDPSINPRVGDGFIRLDADGTWSTPARTPSVPTAGSV